MIVTLDPLPMKEASVFWKDKVLVGPKDFTRLSKEAKIRAFAVSGIAKGDELTTVYRALQRAIEDGISFGDFKKQCRGIFERRGWTGKRSWRVQNIFRTNIQTAYNAGQYKRQKEMADTFPYLQYSAINDRRTRPTHKAMDDKVFPVDHPFWDKWYPPNGFRCRCTTLSLTERQVKRMGLQVESKDPTNTPVEIADPVTGAKLHVQQLLPDPGFGYHPGKLVWGGILDGFTNRLQKVWPDLIGTQAIAEAVEGPLFKAWYEEPQGNFPVLMLADDAAQTIKAENRVALLSKESLEKNLDHHPELTLEEYRHLPAIGADPNLIVQTREKTVVLVRRKGKWYMAAVKATGDGKELYVTSFRKTNDSDISQIKKNGKVVYEKK